MLIIGTTSKRLSLYQIQWKNVIVSAVHNFYPFSLTLKSSVNTYSSCTTKRKWSNANQRKFLQEVAAVMHLNQQEDWQQIDTNILKQLNASSLLKRYNWNIYSLLCHVYPEREWDITICRASIPKSYWTDNIENQRKFLDKVAFALKINSMKDWKRVDVSTFKSVLPNSSSLLALYNFDISTMLKTLYNEHSKVELREYRNHMPLSYWNNVVNQRKFLNNVVYNNQSNSTSCSMNTNCRALSPVFQIDWKHITTRFLKDNGASTLLAKYSDNIFTMLNNIYPEKKWDAVDCRNILPNGYWDNIEHHRAFILRMLNEQKSPSEIATPITINNITQATFLNWPTLITVDKLKQANGTTLLSIYGDSVGKMMSTLFPSNYKQWLEIEKQREDQEVINFVKVTLQQTFSINNQDDWYRISLDQIRSVGGWKYLNKYGRLAMMQLAFPHVDWDERLFATSKKKAAQRWLLLKLQEIFPNELIHEDYLHKELGRQSKINSVELDIYLPQLQIAFEYQGKHHYVDSPSFDSLELQLLRDQEKLELCERNDIKLVHIPYWWDNTLSSLYATIRKEIPDLALIDCSAMVKENAIPIPSIPPRVRTSTKQFTVSTIHKLLMLSQPWHAGIEPEGYWISEKYDGVRAIWHSATNSIVSRYGNQIFPPSWWLAQLPKSSAITAFDGELWMGKENLSQLVTTLHKAQNQDLNANNDLWAKIKFLVFDFIPEHKETDLKFEQRNEKLLSIDPIQIPLQGACVSTEEECNYLSINCRKYSSQTYFVNFKKCKGKDHLLDELKKVTIAGGEGLIIRQPESKYESCRSFASLKVKQTFDDELIYVAKARKTVGFICKRLPKGDENNESGIVMRSSSRLENGAGGDDSDDDEYQIVRCKMVDYKYPPKKGTPLTVKHYGVWPKSGKFKYPFLYRVRQDI